MIFSIQGKEKENFENWFAPHKKLCRFWQVDENGFPDVNSAIGGAFSFTFTPTGIGTGVDVKCVCGETCDLTDYNSW